jgi:NgoMIV restriction enzyme
VSDSVIATARANFHRRLIDEEALALRDGVVTTADRDNAGSTRMSELLAATICNGLGLPSLKARSRKVDSGKLFENSVRSFLDETLGRVLATNRGWDLEPGGSIGRFAQYHHLQEIARLSDENPELRIALGGDYLIGPDICVSRRPLDDESLGETLFDPDDHLARSTFLRSANNSLPLLHGSVSCKWTMRSDRAQNARTEALNLLRNRKGRAPAICLVTAEPMPSRLASLAEGTGDVDRVYHFALYELEQAVAQAASENKRLAPQQESLERMIKGLRLADISDLPFDLLV